MRELGFLESNAVSGGCVPAVIFAWKITAGAGAVIMLADLKMRLGESSGDVADAQVLANIL